MGCWLPHFEFARTVAGQEAQHVWLRRHGYTFRRCPRCRRPRILVAPDGSFVESFAAAVLQVKEASR